MKKLFLICFFTSWLFSLEITNGDVEIYATLQPKKLSIDNKAVRWIKSPKDKNISFAIVAAGYHKKGKISLSNGDEKQIYKVVLGKYKREKITVAKSKANPPKSVLKRIENERNEANKIYKNKSEGLKISTKFLQPINSKITSPFGTARVFNKSVKSFHGGIDYRAAVNTPIIAVNDGVVVIAKDRYYAGGSVVIDHGEGIYTQYYHLESINVKVGDSVKKGDKIGLSGATGRVSGPHLHFGVW